MNKHGLIAAWIVLIGLTTPLLAQGDKDEKPKQQAGTKIAVMNVKEVFEKYVRAIAAREELEQSSRPYQQKAKKLREQVEQLEEEIKKKPNLPIATKEGYDDVIRKNKFDLEELTIEFSRVIKRKHEKKLEMLWKEIECGAKAVAEGHGFQLVLPCGEPYFPVPTLKTPAYSDFASSIRIEIPKRNPRSPLYIHGSVDITPNVLRVLHDWCDKSTKNESDTEKKASKGGYR